jgi:hypothetical protein
MALALWNTSPVHADPDRATGRTKSRQPPRSADNPFKTADNPVILIKFIIFLPILLILFHIFAGSPTRRFRPSECRQLRTENQVVGAANLNVGVRWRSCEIISPANLGGRAGWSVVHVYTSIIMILS